MLPLNSKQIPALYQNAMALQKRGDHSGAAVAYQNILKINPNVAEAHFQLGHISLALKKFDDACAHMAKAVALKPKEPAIWNIYAEVLLRLNDKAQTKSALKALGVSGLPIGTRNAIKKRIQNRSAKSSVKLGGIKPQHIQNLLQIRARGNSEQVELNAKNLLRQNPDVAIVHNILAESLHLQGKDDAAKKHYNRAIALDPDYAEGHSHYGIFLLDIGQPEEAIRHLETARSKIPGSALNLTKLAQAYFAVQNSGLALSTVEQAIKLAPKDPTPHLLRGQILAADNKHDQAISSFEKAVLHGDKSASTQISLAQALSRANLLDRAIATLDQIIKTNPDADAAYDSKIAILQTHGEFEQADLVFQEVLKNQPKSGDLFRKYSASHKFEKDDPVLEHMLEQINDADLPDQDKSQFGFAISKAMEDIKSYDRVFEFLNPANALVRKENPFDISTIRKEIDLIKSVFQNMKPNLSHSQSSSDFAPIFVTGMPRSGTTLIEQIISSHSDVVSLGELGWLMPECFKLANAHLGDAGQPMPIPSESVDGLAAKFEHEIRSTFKNVKNHITDKSIQSYMFMGLIWAAFPNAKIIVVRRDPRDNLLSIYKNVFPPNMQLGAYDLDDLKQQYLMFVELLDFWKSIDPDRYHEVHYEDIIADPEPEIRKLISTCGLEWQDKCLNFHQNKNRVDTLSVYQVRQPIYASSLKAWEHYKDELKDFLVGLDASTHR